MNRTRWLSSVFLLAALAFALPPGVARGEGSGALDAIAPVGRTANAAASARRQERKWLGWSAERW